MIDKKVVVVATGGTIAMKYDPEKDGLVPACTGEDLAAAVPGLGEVAPLEFIQFSNIASPGMTPQNMWDLHLKLEEVLARDDVAGAIVTHGTDTLEETSYFLDLLHTSPKPIVTTAAMRGAGDTSPDGPMNIYCAVKTAASQEAVGMGVLVCLNETLHAPGEVMKTHSANPATFQSPWWGPIGYVDLDKIIIRRKPLNVLRFAPKSLTARVDLIKCMTGSTRDYIDFAVSNSISHWIERIAADKKNIIIINSSSIISKLDVSKCSVIIMGSYDLVSHAMSVRNLNLFIYMMKPFVQNNLEFQKEENIKFIDDLIDTEATYLINFG